MITQETCLPAIGEIRGVFLDRDGVINRERSHVRSEHEFELLPGVSKAIGELNRRNVKVAVLTNQSGIARGYLTEEDLDRIHDHMRVLLARGGARIDHLSYSPWLNKPGLPGGVERFLKDHPDRKPNPGMLHKALDHFGMTAGNACYVGDSGRDLEAANRAAMRFFGIASDKIAELAGQAEIWPSLETLVDEWIRRGLLPPEECPESEA